MTSTEASPVFELNAYQNTFHDFSSPTAVFELLNAAMLTQEERLQYRRVPGDVLGPQRKLVWSRMLPKLFNLLNDGPITVMFAKECGECDNIHIDGPTLLALHKELPEEDNLWLIYGQDLVLRKRLEWAILFIRYFEWLEDSSPYLWEQNGEKEAFSLKSFEEKVTISWALHTADHLRQAFYPGETSYEVVEERIRELREADNKTEVLKEILTCVYTGLKPRMWYNRRII